MNNEVSVPPNYKVTGDTEIDGNPLLAHLPAEPDDDKECYKRLMLALPFDASERTGRQSLRRRRIQQLARFFVPADPVYADALKTISSNFVESYIHRNPMTAEGQAQLHGRSASTTFRPGICLISGMSGMGKSTLCDRVLNALGPHVTRHENFHGVPFPEMQILYLRRNIPPNCTPTRLARTFGTYVDQITQLPMYADQFNKLRKKGGGQDVYLEAVARICSAHHVGGLVLDEIQNLLGAGFQKDRVLELLVNLRDEGGLPIILVGTLKALRLLEGDFAPARRLTQGGYFELVRPASSHDPVWEATCKKAWTYQWLQEPRDFDESILEALYEHSQGITGVMITLLQKAQVLALDEGKETMDSEMLRRAFEEKMQPLHRGIRLLKAGMIDNWEDATANHWPKERQYEDPASAEVDVAVATAPPLMTRSKAAGKAGKANAPVPEQIIKMTPERLREQVMDSNSMRNIISILKG